MVFSRRLFMGSGLAACAAPAWSLSEERFDIAYLERLGTPGELNPNVAFVPPSRVDPAYTHAIYVNTATRSPGGQKMWVLERGGDGWQLALWDDGFWDGAEPVYSWPVSTGRKYNDGSRSGPTPLGIFNVDDRSFRHRKGWGSPGMYNSIYIDLHYSGGRISGVAMHGTPKAKYKRLGTADSHGCIRMEQPNADAIWSMFHGDERPGEGSPLWSEVPRYFETTPSDSRATRWNYVRDGSFLYDASGERLMKPGYSALFVFFRDDT